VSTGPASPPTWNREPPVPNREVIAIATARSKGVSPRGTCIPPTLTAAVVRIVSTARRT
jgi:hypothetical protein